MSAGSYIRINVDFVPIEEHCDKKKVRFRYRGKGKDRKKVSETEFEVMSNITIGDLKQLLYEQKDLDPRCTKIIHNGDMKDDNEKTLADYDIGEGAQIQLGWEVWVNDIKIKVNFEMVENNHRSEEDEREFDVQRDMTIGALKQLLHKEEGLNPNFIQIICNNDIEEDDEKTLADYGIEDGAEIELGYEIEVQGLPPCGSTISVSAIVEKHIETLWNEIRVMNFAWMPHLQECTSTSEGDEIKIDDTRTLVFDDGTVQTVAIRGLDGYDHNAMWELLSSEPSVSFSGAVYSVHLEKVTLTGHTFLKFTSEFSNDADVFVLMDQKFKLEDYLKHFTDATDVKADEN